MKHEGDRRGDARAIGVDLDLPTLRVLGDLEELLRERGTPLGLVARRDRDRIWERHILDALRAVPHLEPIVGAVVADLGSGAGLPGLPVAVVRPDLQVVLVEPKQRRAAFLELAIERLHLANARVDPRRAQELTTGFDICLIRALAPPPEAWALAEPLLVPGGMALVWVGAGDHPWPRNARVRLERTPHLVNAGPIAIMTRQ